MFGFMKKDKDKDKDEEKKRKKDKKERKDSKRIKERAGMTKEELWRLDEARKSLIGKGKKKKEEKLPSGITANYMDQFLSGLQGDGESDAALANSVQEIRDRYEAMASGSSLQSDSSSDGVSLRSAGGYAMQPAKRGILKGASGTEYQGVQGNIDDESSLMHNTSYNETYENLAQRRLERAESESSIQDRSSFGGSPHHVSNGSVTMSPRSPLSPTQSSPGGSHQFSSSSTNLFPLVPPVGSQPHPPHMPSSLPPPTHQQPPNINQMFMMQQVSPQKSTSAIPAGESAGLSNQYKKTFKGDLCLPALVPFQAPSPRTLAIDRLPAGDFGFSLRRTQIVEKIPGRPGIKKTIIFAEPGSVGRTNTTGLLPGDRLLQVNGIPVENKSREEIIELIKASADYVTVVVSRLNYTLLWW